MAAAAARALAGRRILVVEDDFYQAREVTGILERAGASVVGPVAEGDAAVRLIADAAPDHPLHAAIVDINLGRGPSYAVARALGERGVPFLFLTGYDQAAIPADFSAAPSLRKPAGEVQILRCLERLLAAR